MQLKLRAALGLAIGLVAMTGASSAQAATTNFGITIQDARLISPEQILVTGSSNCQDNLFINRADLTEDNGASGVGFNSSSAAPGTRNWAVTVNGADFVKTKAEITVQSQCGVSTPANVTDTRTIPVN